MLQHVDIRNAQAATVESVIGTAPIVRAFQGSAPAALSDAPGTLVAEGALPSDWLGAPSTGVVSKSGTWELTGEADGNINYVRFYDSTGTTAYLQLSAGFASTAWAPSTAYTVGQKVNLGGNVYVCATSGTSASSGGPTGTGSGITDGTVTWNYLHAVPEAAFDNINVANGQTVEIQTFTYTVS